MVDSPAALDDLQPVLLDKCSKHNDRMPLRNSPVHRTEIFIQAQKGRSYNCSGANGSDQLMEL